MEIRFKRNEFQWHLPKILEEIKYLEEDKEYIFEIRPFRKRRSLDANAYFWVLVSKLAEQLRITKEEVYRECIRNIGGNSEIVCVKTQAVERLCQGWQKNGLGWIAETFPSKLEGCTNVTLYYGSSTYDSKQMSDLIEIVVQECKELGIETMTPAELSLLLDGWEGR